VEEDGSGRDEVDSKPSWVTSGAARIGSSSGHEVVQEQATTLGGIPYGWTRHSLNRTASHRLDIIKIALYMHSTL
jgi:hypothetical protein